MLGDRARDFVRGASIGTRVVIRYSLSDGRATDAVGPLLELTATSCTVAAKRGPTSIALSTIIAAKPVPPAPAPRR